MRTCCHPHSQQCENPVSDTIGRMAGYGDRRQVAHHSVAEMEVVRRARLLTAQLFCHRM